MKKSNDNDNDNDTDNNNNNNNKPCDSQTISQCNNNSFRINHSFSHSHNHSDSNHRNNGRNVDDDDDDNNTSDNHSQSGDVLKQNKAVGVSRVFNPANFRKRIKKRYNYTNFYDCMKNGVSHRFSDLDPDNNLIIMNFYSPLKDFVWN